jgi:hypothetical protein
MPADPGLACHQLSRNWLFLVLYDTSGTLVLVEAVMSVGALTAPSTALTVRDWIVAGPAGS